VPNVSSGPPGGVRQYTPKQDAPKMLTYPQVGYGDKELREGANVEG
jgi:hypothetical protein